MALKLRRKRSSGLRKGLSLLKSAQTYSKFEAVLKYADFQELQDGIFSLLIVPNLSLEKGVNKKYCLKVHTVCVSHSYSQTFSVRRLIVKPLTQFCRELNEESFEKNMTSL